MGRAHTRCCAPSRAPAPARRAASRAAPLRRTPTLRTLFPDPVSSPRLRQERRCGRWPRSASSSSRRTVTHLPPGNPPALFRLPLDRALVNGRLHNTRRRLAARLDGARPAASSRQHRQERAVELDDAVADYLARSARRTLTPTTSPSLQPRTRRPASFSRRPLEALLNALQAATVMSREELSPARPAAPEAAPDLERSIWRGIDVAVRAASLLRHDTRRPRGSQNSARRVGCAGAAG